MARSISTREPKVKAYSSALRDTEKSLRAKWQAEKNEINRIQQNKIDIEQLNYEAERAEREGDYAKVAEIRYSRIKQKEDENKAIQARLKELQGEGAMIKEEVDAEDIAEVVSRWTGIPVKKMANKPRARRRNFCISKRSFTDAWSDRRTPYAPSPTQCAGHAPVLTIRAAP